MADLPSNPPKMPKRLFNLLLGAIIACLVFLAGYGLGMKRVPSDGGYRAGYEAARQKLAQSGMLPMQTEIKSIVGTVTAVGESSIDISSRTTPVNPLDEPMPAVRRVLVGPDTKLYRSEPKTLSELEADQKSYADAIKKFEADMSAGRKATYPSMPTPDKRAEITLADIEADDQIAVTAAEDIGYATSFTATEVVVSTLSSYGTMMPPATTPAVEDPHKK